MARRPRLLEKELPREIPGYAHYGRYGLLPIGEIEKLAHAVMGRIDGASPAYKRAIWGKDYDAVAKTRAKRAAR